MSELSLAAMQADLRRAYVGGGMGAIVSGVVWAAAAVALYMKGVPTGFAVLFIGGLAIFPLGVLLTTLLFGKVDPVDGNPGGPLVIETLPGMLLGLGLAWLMIPIRPEWVFPIAAIAVGQHYYPFRTAYGDWLYWVPATVMCGLGVLSIITDVPDSLALAVAVAVTEIVFGIVVAMRARREFAASAP